MKEFIAALLKQALEKKRLIGLLGAILLALIASLANLPEGEVKDLFCGKQAPAVEAQPAP